VFCEKCLQKISFIEEQVCPICREKSKEALVCLRCKKNTNLFSLMVVASYSKNKAMEKLIESFKYKFSPAGVEILGNFLCEKITENLPENLREKRNIILSYVPLHRNKQKWREFNQAEILAKYVSQRLNLPLENLLIRIRDTLPQAKLKKAERIKNMKSAFKATREGRGERVLLIDDVATTLSTLENCASPLKEAGFTDVYAAVLARGRWTT